MGNSGKLQYAHYSLQSVAKNVKRTSRAVCLAISWDFRGATSPSSQVLSEHSTAGPGDSSAANPVHSRIPFRVRPSYRMNRPSETFAGLYQLVPWHVFQKVPEASNRTCRRDETSLPQYMKMPLLAPYLCPSSAAQCAPALLRITADAGRRGSSRKPG